MVPESDSLTPVGFRNCIVLDILRLGKTLSLEPSGMRPLSLVYYSFPPYNFPHHPVLSSLTNIKPAKRNKKLNPC